MECTGGRKHLREMVPERNRRVLEQKLEEMGLVFKQKEEYLIVDLPDSLAALPVLDAVRDDIGGFEMVQGSMDDVFLNVTGKNLEA